MEKIKILAILVLVGIILLWLTGCQCFKKPEVEIRTVVKTVTVEVDKPVFQCPTEIQNLQQPQRPTLMLNMLSPEDSKNPGQVALYYKASVKQLLNYAQELESNTTLYKHACE